jgi:hypothetical protein
MRGPANVPLTEPLQHLKKRSTLINITLEDINRITGQIRHDSQH